MTKFSTNDLLDFTWFHAEENSKSSIKGDFTNRKPSVDEPLWASARWFNAQEYGGDKLYAIFLDPHAKIINLIEEIGKLSGKTYFSDKTLEMIYELYHSNSGHNLWEIEHLEEFLKGGADIVNSSLRKVITEDLSKIKILNDVMAAVSSTFHHNFPDEDKISQKLVMNCRLLHEICKNKGHDSVTDAVFKDRVRSSGNLKELMARMQAETIDALALGKYPLKVMAFRKVLIHEAGKSGYDAVIDKDTNGNDCLEIGILNLKGIDKISNLPLGKRLEDKLHDIHGEITKMGFMKILNQDLQ